MSETTLTRDDMIKLDKMVREAVDSFTRSEAESSFRKDVASRAKDELGIQPSLFNSIVKERFNESITEKLSKLEEVIDMNDELIAAAKGVN